MKNQNIKDKTRFKNVRKIFSKTLVISFVLGMLSAVLFSQSNNLYYQRGGAYYGRVTVYPSHYYIAVNDGSEIKTFRNSCSSVTSNGVAGLQCTFGQFRGGRHIFSGRGQFYQNGIVYLIWTNENVGGGGNWRQINSGWWMFIPR